jgi:hypothetical protein
MRGDRFGETLLPQRIAPSALANDAPCSVAYPSDEIFLTLVVTGGCLATTHSWQIGRGLAHARATTPAVLEAITVKAEPDETKAPQEGWEVATPRCP